MHGKIYRMGAAVQIRHRTEATRLACAGKAALRRTFGAAWELISLALSVMMNVANLAEVGQFACVTLRRVADASSTGWFALRCGCVEILFQGIETRAVTAGPGDEGLLGRIQAVIIERITVNAPIPA